MPPPAAAVRAPAAVDPVTGDPATLTALLPRVLTAPEVTKLMGHCPRTKYVCLAVMIAQLSIATCIVSACMPARLPTCMIASLHARARAYLLARVFACVPACLPVCVPV